MKLITFDDGYETTYTKALPHMKAKRITGVIFVIVDLIGGKDRMTVDQLLELQNHGWQIGSHTLSHPNLNAIPMDQVEREIVHSKLKLIEMGFKVNSFAYPYGRWNKDVVNIVKKHYGWARAVDSTDGSRWTKLVDNREIAMIHSIDQPRYPCNMSFQEFKRICNDYSCPVLHCFMSWGRKDLTEQSFDSLLKSVRKQDRILVVDQEAVNFDFFAKHRDKIDFLVFPKLNYEIGPAWMLIRNILLWKIDTSAIFYFDRERRWLPDYVNIVENDTLGKEGWVDRLVDVFGTEKERIGIVTGYEADVHKPIRKRGNILIKNLTPGVQMMMQTNDFMNTFQQLMRTRQDFSICKCNEEKGKVIGVLPGEIKHTGDGRGRSKK